MRALFDRFRAAPHALRRVAFYILLAAFAAQGLLTQGHRHFADARVAVSGLAVDQTTGKQPIKADQSNCPICHAASVAGAFFAPTASALWVPSLGALVKPRDERVVIVERFAVHWRSRAPPQV